MNKRKSLLIAIIGILNVFFIGCDDDVKIDSDVKAESTINFIITASPDLLKFMTPQVRYVDENGNIVTITGVEELDGKVIKSKAEVQNGGSYASAWTSQVITGTGYKCWTVQMKFNRLNFHSFMGVKYIRNDFTEDTTGKEYDFHHNVNTSISVIKMKGASTKAYTDGYVSVSIGNYKEGDDVNVYLDNLEKNIDKVGYYIDEDGNAAREDDFEI